jgi:hypothetical protein
MSVNPEPLDWAEVVLHVLAHLPETVHLPSSLYSPAYVEAACRALGAPGTRHLGDDIPLLARCLTSHGPLAAIQVLTRLHPNLEEATKLASLSLRELQGRSELDARWLRPLLDELLVPAELLRCAALLEAPNWRTWPLPSWDELAHEVAGRLPRLFCVAPVLEQTTIRFLRALGGRGRAWEEEIWIGAPEAHDEPALALTLWQAAHEAVVLETVGRARAESLGLGEREVEELSVFVLAERAKRHGLSEQHQRWLLTQAVCYESMTASPRVESLVRQCSEG